MVSVCFLFKQKTAYEMRISDWSSDVCSSDLPIGGLPQQDRPPAPVLQRVGILDAGADVVDIAFLVPIEADDAQAERVACQRNVEIGRASCRERVCQYV